MAYLDPAIIDDEGATAQGILQALADSIDGFSPAEGGITAPLAESVGIAIATAVTELKNTALDAYMGFGQAILAIPRTAAGVATVKSTWTFSDNTGFEIPAGTEVQADKPDGTTVIFTATDTTTVVTGVTGISGVELAAVESGPDSNGATGAATAAALISESGNTVQSVTLEGASAGGADEEDPLVYAGRLADHAKRLHVLPVTPEDYAALSLDVPGYASTVALNRYDPASPGTDSPGEITIVGRDSAGAAVSSGAKAALAAYFGAMELPLSVVIHTLDSAFVDLTVTGAIVVADDADPDAVAAASEDAVRSLLDPATFDSDPDRPGGWASPRSSKVTVFDLAAAIDDIDGLEKISSLTVGTPAVNEIETVSVTATGGTLTLTFDGQTTAGIAFDATAAAVQSALEALSNVAPGDVAVSAGPLSSAAVVVEFTGARAGMDVVEMTADGSGLTGAGAGVTVATTRAGAAATSGDSVSLPPPVSLPNLISVAITTV